MQVINYLLIRPYVEMRVNFKQCLIKNKTSKYRVG